MDLPARPEIYLVCDSPKLAHTIELIIQNYGRIRTGELNETIPSGYGEEPIRLVVVALSHPVSLTVFPAVLNWFLSDTGIPILLIADQPLSREKKGRQPHYLQYPFDAQALCDTVTALLGLSQLS